MITERDMRTQYSRISGVLERYPEGIHVYETRPQSSTEARLRALQTLRLRLHRLQLARPLRDVRAAVAFIKAQQIVLSTGRSSLPMLAEAIAGRPLAGSWMAHPEVYRIYRILGRIYKHNDVVAAPLILGKETLIHASLAPAVQRIAADEARREEVRKRLPALARRLLQQVESEGHVRMDRWDVPTDRARKARLLLERELMLVSKNLHTERGYHTSIVIPWSRSRFSERFARDATQMTFEEAVDSVLLAAVRSAVVVPEREVRRWLVTGVERVEALVTQEKLERLRIARASWLTIPSHG